MNPIKNVILLSLILLLIIGCSNTSSVEVGKKVNSVVLKTNDLPLANEQLKEGWRRFQIKDLGNIDIPPTLELQAGTFKKFADSINTVFEVGQTDLVFQQIGANQMTHEGFKKYARIMIDVVNGQSGQYENLNTNLSVYTSEVLGGLEKDMTTELLKGFIKTNTSLIDPVRVTAEILNGMTCLHINYKRQIKGSSAVLVNQYIFQNSNQLIKFTLSFRINEDTEWHNDFNVILKSFRITKIN